MSKYYLVNGTPANAKIVSLPGDSTLVKEFNDISDIDLITSKINIREAKGTLKIYNESLLNGPFLIMEYPVCKTKGILYRPLFDETKDKTRCILPELIKYAEERSNKAIAKLSDKKVSLELDRDDEFYYFLSTLIDELYKYGCNSYKQTICGYNSLLTRDFITQFVEYKKPQTHTPYELDKLTRSLSNYKALRNFLMEYIAWKNKNYLGLKHEVKSYTGDIVAGKMYADEQLVKNALASMDNYQYTLEDYIKVLHK